MPYAHTLPLAWAAHAPWMEPDAWGACHSVSDTFREGVVKGVHLYKHLWRLISIQIDSSMMTRVMHRLTIVPLHQTWIDGTVARLAEACDSGITWQEVLLTTACSKDVSPALPRLYARHCLFWSRYLRPQHTFPPSPG